MFIVPFLPANQLLHSVMLRFLTASVALGRNVGFCPLATGTPYSANGFGVFLLYQFFKAIPKDLEEAAIIDGASKFQVWSQVFVPLSIPATATLALLTFLNVYNDFFWPLVSSTSLEMRTLTVGVAIMAIGAFSTHYPLLMALTLFSVIPMVLAFLFAQKQLVQGVATTGMKE